MRFELASTIDILLSSFQTLKYTVFLMQLNMRWKTNRNITTLLLRSYKCLFFVYFLRCYSVLSILCLCRPFFIFERCPDSNPEKSAVTSRRTTNLATHLLQLSQQPPISPNLATHLPSTQPPISHHLSHPPPPTQPPISHQLSHPCLINLATHRPNLAFRTIF